MLGTAKEYPTYEPVCDDIAVLIPTKSPFVFTKAPPEFPGLTAASVCIKDWFFPRLRTFALIIPAVTVDVRLKGLPTAKTHSPIFVWSESPNAK